MGPGAVAEDVGEPIGGRADTLLAQLAFGSGCNLAVSVCTSMPLWSMAGPPRGVDRDSLGGAVYATTSSGGQPLHPIYAVLQGTILFVAVAFVVINLLTDLAYALLDPRIRYS